MPDAVTLKIDRHRKTGDVGGKDLDMNGQGGDPPPVAHGPDPQIIDAFQYLGFQFGDLRIRVRIAHPAQKGLFGQQHAFFRRPPDADTDDNGRTGIGACLIDALHDKIDDPLLVPSAGGSMASRLMFSLPNPLESAVIFNFSPGTMVVWITAGVLSFVLILAENGLSTTDLRRYPWA